jgi:hypothetical protein
MFSALDQRSLSSFTCHSMSRSHLSNDYETCFHSHGPHPHGHITLKSSALWLVPQNTKPSQCLHLSLTTKDPVTSSPPSPSTMSPSPPPSPHKGNSRDEIIEIVASEYQCLYGHRCSHLLIELYQKMNQDHDQQQSQSQSQQTCLSLVEDGQMNILQALLYIHSDSPEKILSDCSPLILGRTASYLQIHHLCRLIADEASLTLAFYLDRALEPGALQMTVWDAIALLHLLGDHEDLLPLVQLSHWCHR